MTNEHPADLAPILEAIADRAARLCESKDARIFVLEGEVLRYVAGFGEVPYVVRPPRPLTRGLVGARAVIDRAVVHIEDIAAVPETEYPEEHEYQRQFGHRTTLAVPLLRGDKAIGMILLRRSEVRPFDPKHVELVKAFADQAAVAIENLRLSTELKTRNAELTEALEQQTATAEILKVISGSPTDIQPVLDAVTESAARLCDANDVIIRRVDGDVLRLAAHLGSIPVVADAVTITRGTVPGCAVVERRTIHIHDILEAHTRGEYPEGASLQRGAGDRTFLAVPLLREDVAVGVIAIRRLEVRPFSDKQIRLLETFAAQAVIAIENVRLFNETKEALEQQTATAEILKVISSSPTDIQPVLDAVAESAARLCGASDAVIRRVDGDVVRVAAHHGAVPLNPESLVRRLTSRTITCSSIRERRTIHVHDMSEPRVYEEYPDVPPMGQGRRTYSGTLLVVPLLQGDTAIGSINIRRPEARPFSEKQIKLLETFAAQAVIAIENVRLFNETKESLEQQTATAEILKVISRSPTDIQPVLDAVAESAARYCGASDVIIRRVDSEVLRTAAHFGSLPVVGETVALTRMTFGGRAALERRTIHIHDIGDEQVRKDYPEGTSPAHGASFRTLLVAPLLREDTSIGVITMRRQEVCPFSDKQIKLLETFAAQASIAIENVRLFSETKEALEQQTVISEILRVISRSPTDTQPVFDAIVESGLRLFGGSNVSLRLVKGDYTEIVAGTLPVHETSDAFRIQLDDESVPSVRSVRWREFVHVPDILAAEWTSEHARDRAKELGFRAIMCAPMLRENHAVGSINVFRAAPGSFTEKQVALLKTFADQAVIAIENVRLFNETKEALEQQTATAEILRVISSSPIDVQPVLDAVAENATRVCEAGDGLVLLIDGGACRVAAHYGTITTLPRDEAIPITRGTVAGRAILEGGPVHVPDILAAGDDFPEGRAIGVRLGLRTTLATPLLREGTPIGALLIRRTEVRPFSDKQIKLLETFAAQAVIAIENVRLFNETKEALEQQTATAEILKVISSSPTDIQPVLDAVTESAARLCGASDAIIRLVEGDFVRVVAHQGAVPIYPGGAVQALASKTVSSRAIHERRTIHVHDMSEPRVWEEYPDIPQARGQKGRVWSGTMLVVPLLREDKAIGVINIRRPEVRPFSDKQIKLLETFAAQAVIAIENVRLFNETKEALERQTATAEVLQVISGSPTDVQPVLDAVAERAARLCEASNASIDLLEGDVLRRASSHGDVTFLRNETFPLDRGVMTARAVLERRAIHVHDISAERSEYPLSWELAQRYGHRAILVAPLMKEGKAIGTIVLRRRESRPFSEKQIALIQTFADQAVIAIENVRLFNETKEALEQQTATAEILKVISSSPTDVQPVFAAIVNSGVGLFRGLDVTVRLVKGDHIESVASTLPRLGERIPLTDDGSPSSQAIRRREVIRVPDVFAEGAVGEKTKQRCMHLGVRAILVAPMTRDNTAIGAIIVNRAVPGAFTEKEVALLKTFADQAVIAIENVRLFNETKEALEQQTATADVLRVISSSPTDVQPVLNTVAERSGLLCQAEGSRVWLARNGQMHAMASYGTVYGSDSLREVLPLQTTTVVGRAFLERRCVHVEDIVPLIETEYPDLRELQARLGFRTVLAVPMLREGEPIGVIALIRNQRPFAPAEISLIETFAAQAVIAIENVRLFNETKEALEQQTATAEILKVISSSPTDVQPVFDAIVKSGVHLFRGMNVTLRLVKGDQTVIAASTRPPHDLDRVNPLNDDRIPSARAIMRREVVQIPDISAADWVGEGTKRRVERQGLRALLTAPMLRENTVIGVITVHRASVGPFTEKEVALLKTFADQAVIAIENVRLFKELQARNAEITESLEQQTATAEILEVISSSPTDVQPVFDAIAESAARLCEASDVIIRRVDGVAMRLVAHSGSIPVRTSDHSEVSDKTFMGRAVRERRSIHIHDVLEPHVREEYPESLIYHQAGGGYRTVLVVPLLREDTVIGVIVIRRADVRPFSEKQIKLLETFARQAVIAIENVRLFNETKDALEQQTVISEILRVISSSPTDVQPVFDAIVKSGLHLFRGSNVSLRLVKGDQTEMVASTLPLPAAAGVASLNDDGVPSSRAILRREVVHVPDIDTADWIGEGVKRRAESRGSRAVLAAPMLRENNPIGTILVNRATPGPFTEKQIALLKTFADQAVIAIENVRLFKELQARNAEITESLEQQTATAEILKVISSSPTDIQPVFDTILEKATRLCDAHLGLLGLYDGEKFEMVAQRGANAEYAKFLRERGPFRPLPGGPFERMMAERQPIHIEDRKDSPAYRDRNPHTVAMVELGGARTYVAVPMLKEGRIVGAISIYRPVVQPFTQKQIDLVSTFASQAVIAIENVRLFKELQTRNVEITESLEQQTATAEILRVISGSPTDIQPVFDAILEKAISLCDAHMGVLGLYDGETYQNVAQRGASAEYAKFLRERGPFRPPPGGRITRMIAERQPIQIEDTRESPPYRDRLPGIVALVELGGARTSIQVPMLKEGRVVGSITVYRPEVRLFTQKQIDLVSTFASQAVIAIENVRLFNETKEALEQQTVISEILRVISSSPTDTQPVFDAIVKSGVNLFGGMIVSLRLVKGDHIETVASTRSGSNTGVPFRTPLHDESAPASRAILRREVVQIPDFLASEEWVGAVAKQRAEQQGFRALMSAPMLRENNAIGVINVIRAAPGPFTDKQVALLKTFADQAVIAIENVRLFKELQARNTEITESLEQQTATADILRVISSSPTDIQPVFDAILENATRLCGAHMANLGLYDGDKYQAVAQRGVKAELAKFLSDRGPQRFAPDSGVGRMIAERQPIQIPDLKEGPGYRDGSNPNRVALVELGGVRTYLVVPMLKEGSVVGGIAIYRPEVRPFTQKQIDLVSTFANQAVIAIENVRLFKELQARNAEITESLEQQTATAEVLKVISRSTFDLDPVLVTLIENATMLCHAEQGFIFRFDGEFSRLVASHNTTPEFRAFIDNHPIPPGRGTLVGRVVLERSAVHIPDAVADPEYEWRESQALGRFRTMLGIPMLRQGVPIGVIALWRGVVQPFSEKEIELVTTFADQAVIAIENVRLFKELQARNAEITESLEQQTATAEILKVISSSPTDIQPVFDAILENATRLCGAHMGVLGLYDGRSYHRVAQRGASAEFARWLAEEGPKNPPDAHGEIMQMIAERRPIHDLDRRESRTYRERTPSSVALVELGGARSSLVVPMLKEGRVVGGIVIYRPEVQPFTQKQIDLVSTFASQAVIAIENVRLFKELQARNAEITESLDQQTATSEVLRVIASTPTDLKPVLDTVIANAVKLAGATQGHIRQYDGDVLQVTAHYGETPEQIAVFKNLPVRPDDGSPSSRAFLEKRPIHVPDAQVGREKASRAALIGARTLLAVPLLREGTPIGVMTIWRSVIEPFTERQVDLVKTFASQAVIAIENVRLFKELQARNAEITESLEQQTATSEVLKVISRSTFDLDPVLETLVENARKLCGADRAAISRADKDGNYVTVIERGLERGSDFLAYVQRHPIRPDRGTAVGRAVVERRPVHIPDILADPEYKRLDLVDIRRFRTVLAVPMLREGEPIGVFVLTRTKEVKPFTEKQVELVTGFADQAVIAIENVRLFNEIQEKGRELEAANKHKSEFLANMSHELRTPLNAVIGFSDLLLERMFGELNAKQENYMKNIQASGKHLLSLINDILDLSKIEAGRMELDVSSVDIPSALQNAMMLIRERAQRQNIALSCNVDSKVAEISADERKFKQIMLNLLSNAVKFTPEGGRVDVGARLLNGHLEVSVKDTGVGIAKENQQAVFEEFRQVGRHGSAKQEGTGLGLALTRRFVELHGGTIKLESEPGKGSTFTFTIPVQR